MQTVNLAIPLAKRLENWRKHKARPIIHDGSYCPANMTDYDGGSFSRGTNDGGKTPIIYFSSEKKLEQCWRNAGHADEIIPRSVQHTGWYTNEEMDMGTLRGIVAQLPARNGKEIYLAGYVASDWDSVCFELNIYDDKEDAARAADCIAENAAEREREFQAEDRRKMRLSELRAENKETRKEIATLKGTIRRLREDIATNKRKIAELE